MATFETKIEPVTIDYAQTPSLMANPPVEGILTIAPEQAKAMNKYWQLKLVEEFHPILKTRCSEVLGFDDDLKDLAAYMHHMMEKKGGVGLSANQLGVGLRIFVMRQLTKEGKTQKEFTMINPTIIKTMGTEEIGGEGCLSYPNLLLKIKRSQGILAEYYDLDGNKITRDFWGVDARCFQHELDHLNGIRFTDKVSSGILTNAREKQRKWQKQSAKLSKLYAAMPKRPGV